MSIKIFALLLLILTSKYEVTGNIIKRRLDYSDDEIISEFISTVSEKDRKKYEDLLETKNSFQNSISFLPNTFQPESQEYWDKNNKLIVVFSLIALIPLFFIFVYFVVRFVFKKCQEPAKISDISKWYRYNTWIIFLIGVGTTLGLMISITSYSEKSKDAILASFDSASSTISETQKSTDFLSDFTQKYKDNLTEANLPKFENYSLALEVGLKEYINHAEVNIDEAKKLEKDRALGTIFLLIYFLIIIVLTLIGFIFRRKRLVMILALITFISIPGIIVFDGYVAKFFFYYGDLCNSVNKAMYKGEFPVPNQALGYFVNCLEKETKFNLYIINNQFYRFQNSGELKPEQKDTETLQRGIDKLIKCESVYKVIPSVESNFCAVGIDWFLMQVQLYIWLIVALIVLGVAIGRIEILVWRKNKEIESMIEGMEAVY